MEQSEATPKSIDEGLAVQPAPSGDDLRPPEAIAAQQEEMAALRQELEDARHRLSSTVSRFRALLLSTSPDLPGEMVEGETIEELEASAERARALVQRIRRELQTALSQERIPAGAPGRTSLDLSSLPTHEKIALGLRRQE